jgi:hypothetical protein
MSDVEVRARIAADPRKVYDLVSDLPRMGQWSPENTGGRWINGSDGPAVRAKFKGNNRKGLRRWSTTVTVTAADPGARFAFDVTYGPLPISTWEYTFTATGDGCEVAEAWSDRRPSWMKVASGPVMGVRDRLAYNRAGMEQTLAALKRAAEG